MSPGQRGRLGDERPQPHARAGEGHHRPLAEKTALPLRRYDGVRLHGGGNVRRSNVGRRSEQFFSPCLIPAC